MIRRHSLIRFFFSVFLFLILTSQVSAQQDQKIKFKSEYSWKLSCTDFKNAKVTQGKYLKPENINKALSTKYHIRDKIFKEHYYHSKNKVHDIVSVTKNIGDGTIDITTNVIDDNEIFCLDNYRSKDEILTIRTKEIYYFEIACVNNEFVSHQIILDTISSKLNKGQNKLPLLRYMNDPVNLYSEKLPENIEFLTTDLYQYSNIRNPIKCSTDYPIIFSVKNIQSYLPITTQALTTGDPETIPEPSLPTSCMMSYEEKVEATKDIPPECVDEVEEAKKEAEEAKKKKLEVAEIKDNNATLDRIYGLFSDTEEGGIFEIIGSVSLNELKEDIHILSINYQEIDDVKKIQQALSILRNKFKKVEIIFIYHDLYSKMCVEGNFEHSKLPDYTDKCSRIQEINNLEYDNNSQKLKYIEIRKTDLWEDWQIAKNFSELENNINKRIKKIKEKEKSNKDVEKKEEEIDKHIENIKKGVEHLKEKINLQISKVDDFINDFSNNNDDTIKFLDFTPAIKEIDKNYLTKLGLLIKKFPEGYDSSFYENEKHILEGQIIELNSLNDDLINKTRGAKFKISERKGYKKLKHKEDERIGLEEEKKKKEEEEKIAEEERKKEKKIAEDLDAQEKKVAKANLEKLEGDINRKIEEIEKEIKNITNAISSNIQSIDEFIENFDARNTYTNNFDILENEILSRKNTIEGLINELSKLIKGLPEDYDSEIFDDKRQNSRRDFDDINTDKLDEKIFNAKSLLNSQNEKIGDILQDQDKLIIQLESRIKILENNKTTSEIDLLDSLEKSRTHNEKLTGDKIILADKIDKLTDKIDKKNLFIYILIAILIILLGLIIYLVLRRKSSKNADESTSTRNYLSRIDELERKLENQSAGLQYDKKQADVTSIEDKKIEQKEEDLPPDPQKEKDDKLMKVYADYEEAMKNPRLFVKFQSDYEAIGLEREPRIASRNKVTLRKTNKSFDKADFWTVLHDHRWLVFGGHILKVQAPSFLADDGTRARNLLQGIFQLEFGTEFRTMKCAIVNKINQIYEVRAEGKMQMPKIDTK